MMIVVRVLAPLARRARPSVHATARSMTSMPPDARDSMARLLEKRAAMVSDVRELIELLDDHDLLGPRDEGLGRDIRNMLAGELGEGGGATGLAPRVVDPDDDLRALAGLRERLREHLARAEAVHGADSC